MACFFGTKFGFLFCNQVGPLFYLELGSSSFVIQVGPLYFVIQGGPLYFAIQGGPFFFCNSNWPSLFCNSLFFMCDCELVLDLQYLQHKSYYHLLYNCLLNDWNILLKEQSSLVISVPGNGVKRTTILNWKLRNKNPSPIFSLDNMFVYSKNVALFFTLKVKKMQIVG